MIEIIKVIFYSIISRKSNRIMLLFILLTLLYRFVKYIYIISSSNFYNVKFLQVNNNSSIKYSVSGYSFNIVSADFITPQNRKLIFHAKKKELECEKKLFSLYSLAIKEIVKNNNHNIDIALYKNCKSIFCTIKSYIFPSQGTINLRKDGDLFELLYKRNLVTKATQNYSWCDLLSSL
jgi:hypothetical protein